MDSCTQAWADYAEANGIHFHSIDRELFFAGYMAHVDEYLRTMRGER